MTRHRDCSERGLELYYLCCLLVSTASFVLLGLWQPPGWLAAVFFTCAGLCVALAFWLGVRCARGGAAQASVAEASSHDRSERAAEQQQVLTFPIYRPSEAPRRRA
jgi:uncharacterized membrane protein